MINDTDIAIVRIEPIGAPYKTNQPYATSWYVPVRYHLEDGQTVDTRAGFYSTKRDALAGSRDEAPSNMWASFDSIGRYTGFKKIFGLGR